MRKRHKRNLGLTAGSALLALSASQRLWARAARRPVDSLAIFAAVAASIVIVVNALALQSGPRPAPFIVNAPPSPPANATLLQRAALRPTMHSIEATPTVQTVAAPRRDPIAQLIGISSRVAAVQRVLSEYGYGQIKPSGVLDGPTRTAIEKFEREHKLPVSGRLSERLESGLAVMTGHPLQ